MKRVAVFGNAGGGKSTLARRLAELTRLQLVADAAASKRVHHVTSPAEMTAFLDAVRREQARG